MKEMKRFWAWILAIAFVLTSLPESAMTAMAVEKASPTRSMSDVDEKDIVDDDVENNWDSTDYIEMTGQTVRSKFNNYRKYQFEPEQDGLYYFEILTDSTKSYNLSYGSGHTWDYEHIYGENACGDAHRVLYLSGDQTYIFDIGIESDEYYLFRINYHPIELTGIEVVQAPTEKSWGTPDLTGMKLKINATETVKNDAATDYATFSFDADYTPLPDGRVSMKSLNTLKTNNLNKFFDTWDYQVDSGDLITEGTCKVTYSCSDFNISEDEENPIWINGDTHSLSFFIETTVEDEIDSIRVVNPRTHYDGKLLQKLEDIEVEITYNDSSRDKKIVNSKDYPIRHEIEYEYESEGYTYTNYATYLSGFIQDKGYGTAKVIVNYKGKATEYEIDISPFEIQGATATVGYNVFNEWNCESYRILDSISSVEIQYDESNTVNYDFDDIDKESGTTLLHHISNQVAQHFVPDYLNSYYNCYIADSTTDNKYGVDEWGYEDLKACFDQIRSKRGVSSIANELKGEQFYMVIELSVGEIRFPIELRELDYYKVTTTVLPAKTKYRPNTNLSLRELEIDLQKRTGYDEEGEPVYGPVSSYTYNDYFYWNYEGEVRELFDGLETYINGEPLGSGMYEGWLNLEVTGIPYEISIKFAGQVIAKYNIDITESLISDFAITSNYKPTIYVTESSLSNPEELSMIIFNNVRGYVNNVETVSFTDEYGKAYSGVFESGAFSDYKNENFIYELDIDTKIDELDLTQDFSTPVTHNVKIGLQGAEASYPCILRTTPVSDFEIIHVKPISLIRNTGIKWLDNYRLTTLEFCAVIDGEKKFYKLGYHPEDCEAEQSLLYDHETGVAYSDWCETDMSIESSFDTDCDAGMYSIDATLMGYTFSIPVEVREVELVDIEFSGHLNKTEVYDSDGLDLSGLKFVFVLNDKGREVRVSTTAYWNGSESRLSFEYGGAEYWAVPVWDEQYADGKSQDSKGYEPSAGEHTFGLRCLGKTFTYTSEKITVNSSKVSWFDIVGGLKDSVFAPVADPTNLEINLVGKTLRIEYGKDDNFESETIVLTEENLKNNKFGRYNLPLEIQKNTWEIWGIGYRKVAVSLGKRTRYYEFSNRDVKTEVTEAVTNNSWLAFKTNHLQGDGYSTYGGKVYTFTPETSGTYYLKRISQELQYIQWEVYDENGRKVRTSSTDVGYTASSVDLQADKKYYIKVVAGNYGYSDVVCFLTSEKDVEPKITNVKLIGPSIEANQFFGGELSYKELLIDFNLQVSASCGGSEPYTFNVPVTGVGDIGDVIKTINLFDYTVCCKFDRTVTADEYELIAYLVDSKTEIPVESSYTSATFSYAKEIKSVEIVSLPSVLTYCPELGVAPLLAGAKIKVTYTDSTTAILACDAGDLDTEWNVWDEAHGRVFRITSSVVENGGKYYPSYSVETFEQNLTVTANTALRTLRLDELVAATLTPGKVICTGVDLEDGYYLYQFTPSENAVYRVRVNGEYDSRLGIYNAEGVELDATDSIYDLEKNRYDYEKELKLVAGETYYISVSKLGVYLSVKKSRDIVIENITDAELIISQPVAGEAYTDIDALNVANTLLADDSSFVISNVSWSPYKSAEIFEVGRVYKLKLTLKANDGYQFTDSTEITAKYAADSLTTYTAAKGICNAEVMTVTFTFPKTDCKVEFNYDKEIIDVDGEASSVAYGDDLSFGCSIKDAEFSEVIVRVNGKLLEQTDDAYLLSEVKENVVISITAVKAEDTRPIVTFESNGEAIDQFRVDANTSISESTMKCLPVLESYTDANEMFFFGWYDKKSGETGNGYGNRMFATTKITKDTTFYARWQKGTFEKVYNNKFAVKYRIVSVDEKNAVKLSVVGTNNVGGSSSATPTGMAIISGAVYAIAYGASTDTIAIDADFNAEELKELLDLGDDAGLELNAEVTDIAPNAFEGCEAEAIVIPETVETIGAGAFQDCKNLTDIQLPATLEKIEDGTFNGCENLSTVIIPEGVTEIGAGVFEGCTNLTDISVPDSIETVDENVFRGIASGVNLVCGSASASVLTEAATAASMAIVNVDVEHGIEAPEFIFDSSNELEFTPVVKENSVVSADYTISVSTSNPDVLDVAEEAGTYKVTANKAYAKGDMEIIVTATKGSVSKSVVYSVSAPSKNLESAVVLGTSVYDGTEQKPTVVVRAGSKLVEGTDYTLTYENNVNAGTQAKVTVTGIGWFKGEITKNFTIDQATKELTVDTTGIKKVYGDKDFVISASVSVAGEKVVFASSNTKVATVDAAGKVKLVGVGTATITVTSPESENCTAAAPKSVAIIVSKGTKTITGLKTAYTVKFGAPVNLASVAKIAAGEKLTYSVDSKYSKIIKVSATGVVTALGFGTGYVKVASAASTKYNAAKTISVKITVATGVNTITGPAATITKVNGSKAFSLGAKAVGGGIIKYASSNSKVATVSSKGAVTIKGVGKAVITITSAKIMSGKSVKYTASKKTVTIIVVPKATSISKISNSAAGKATVEWKKATGASGYQVVYSLDKFKTLKSVTVSSKYVKATLSKLTKGKTYSVKVRPYVTIGGKKYYGSYSAVKTIKISK